MEKNNYAVPIAIVVAGLLIAGAVLFGGNSDRSLFKLTDTDQTDTTSTLVTNLTPVSASDYITGAENPTITVVEYSDLECPFCQVFHQAMKNSLANNQTVAWVYRHFPLDSLHAKARNEAEYSACVGKLAGNDKFWAYIDNIFTVTPSNDGLDPAQLPILAEKIGINKTDLENCVKNGDGKKIVDADYSSGQEINVSGTPYPILIDTDGRAHAIFESNFNPDTAQVSPEAKAFVADLYAEYEKIVKGN